MTEQDFSKRLTIVARKDLPGWQSANAIAHVAAYIGNKFGEQFGTGEFFTTADQKDFPRNSQYPMIIKKAESSDQLQKLLADVREKGLLYHAFIREMIETTSDAEIVTMLATKQGSDVELLAIGVFGTHEEVNALTKKFSLWD